MVPRLFAAGAKVKGRGGDASVPDGSCRTFGGNYVFALDSNNGIRAFLINTNYRPLGSRAHGPRWFKCILTWQSVAGHTYQVQFKDLVAVPGWTNIGSPITAIGGSTSFTNTVPGAA